MRTTGVRWLDVLRLRLRSLWRRNQVESELDSEVAFHRENLIERFLAEGCTRAEATRRANIELGGIEPMKEECRDARGVSFFENLAADVGYAYRGIRHSPGFVVTAAMAIALGIGANTALFSLVYSLLFRPLPVSHPETIRNIHVSTFGEGNRSGYGTPYNVSWDEFNYIRSHSKTADVAGIAQVEMSRKGDSRSVTAHLISDNMLPVLGARPALGRFLLPEETSKPGAAAVVVLTHHAWRDWFGSSPDVVGKTVELNRTLFTVVGVADEQTLGPLMFVPDVWIPLSMQALTRPGETLIDRPSQAWIQLLARRRAGFDDAALTAEMGVLAQQSLQPHLPKRTARVSVVPGSLFNFPFVRQNGGPIIGILFLAVTLVLIVACANVANMLLARGLTRRREIAIRLSIGAGRGRIIQQLLTESVLLALAGATAGLFFAWSAAKAILSMIPVEKSGRLQIDLTPDTAVLIYTLLVAVATGIVFGLLPALNTIRFNLTPALKSEGLGDENSGGRRRLQNGLIAVQVAVCLMLLINAGLLLRGIFHATTLNPGQSTTNVLIVGFDLRQQQYSAEKAARFMNTLRENVSLLPGVRSASMSMVTPLHDQCGSVARVLGPDGSPAPEIRTSCDEVGPAFFETTGIRILHGREFSRAEVSGTENVAIVDERFAKEHFGGAIPIGQSVRLGPAASDDHRIIGVAATTTALDMNGFGFAKVYTPLRGLRNVESRLLVSYSGRPAEIGDAVRKAVGSLDSSVNASVERIEESMADALIPARMAATAAWALGGLALILACTGIYGLVSFAISRRKREVGIRMALGADRAAVLRLVVWQGMKPVAAGAVAGIALAGISAQLIRAMLYGISPLDPVAFLSTGLLLALVALIAAAIPARAAVTVDPALTLRHD